MSRLQSSVQTVHRQLDEPLCVSKYSSKSFHWLEEVMHGHANSCSANASWAGRMCGHFVLCVFESSEFKKLVRFGKQPLVHKDLNSAKG